MENTKERSNNDRNRNDENEGFNKKKVQIWSDDQYKILIELKQKLQNTEDKNGK